MKTRTAPGVSREALLRQAKRAALGQLRPKPYRPWLLLTGLLLGCVLGVLLEFLVFS